MKTLSPDEKSALDMAHDCALKYREDVPRRAVPPAMGLDEAVCLFRQPLGDKGLPAKDVLAALIRDADPGINQMSSGRFYGYVIGGSFPVGVAADYLVSAWGQNAGSAYETPAISGIERALGDWLLDLLGLPCQAGIGLVTGGTIANAEGIMAARHALLAAQGWNVEEKGIFGAPEFPVLIGADAHSAPVAGLRYAGLGAGRSIRVATDDQGCMSPEALETALKECERPPLVILQAGQINTGACDPFEALIPLIRRHEGWAHVDGAFGLWLAAVPELRDRIAGVEQADSWAVDLHKWLSAPFDAGVAIVRDRAALVAAMSARGEYLPQTSAHWEPADSTVELSRRARGVPAYAILKYLGRDGVRALIAGHVRLAEKLAAALKQEPGIHVLNTVVSNQVAIACGETDEQTRAVLAAVQKRGKVYPSHGVWRGRQIIRCSLTSYATDDADIDLLVAEIVEAWRGIRANWDGIARD